MTVLTAAPAGQTGTAEAAGALGCAFDAYAPYKGTDGRIYTKIAVKCSTDRWLYWHARLTKDRNNSLDVTIGSSDGYDLFKAGIQYTWHLSNNRNSCPGSGYFFGKLSIQARPLSDAYADRSSNSYVTMCG